jgi:hypothetical protein
METGMAGWLVCIRDELRGVVAPFSKLLIVLAPCIHTALPA